MKKLIVWSYNTYIKGNKLEERIKVTYEYNKDSEAYYFEYIQKYKDLCDFEKERNPKILKDIPALSLKSEFSFREQTINVSNNKLTSLSFLENSEFSTLIAYKNPIDYDKDTIDKVFKLTADGERKNTIVIDYSANLLSISSLGYFDNIYIANCPIDKMSDFSNTFTDSNVELSYTIEELDAFNEYSPLDMLGWHSYNLFKYN